MHRDEATALLDSSKPNDRLKAARFFSRFATIEDREILKRALRKEETLWVKSALTKAIDLAGGAETFGEVHAHEPDTSDEDSLTNEVYAEAIEETGRLLVHELEPIIGSMSCSRFS